MRGPSASERAARSDQLDACLRTRSTAAVYRVIADAYRAGRLGGPAQIRKDLDTIRRSTDPPPIRSFLRPDGTLEPLRSMDLIQLETFTAWLYVPRVARVGDEAQQAGLDARMTARDACRAAARRG